MKKEVYFIVPVLLIIFTFSMLIFFSRSGHKEINKAENKVSDTVSSSDSSILADYIVITETPVPTNTPKPTPTPTVTPIRISSSELDALFTRYANKESIDPDRFKRIALCESGFNPYARNGVYGGMFQFTENSWTSIRRTMSLSTNPDLRFIPEEAIKTAAFKIASEGIHAWPECSKK